MSNKREAIFEQGGKEDANPYSERDDSGGKPMKATAAQLAARKIKSAKGTRHRTPGATSGISLSSGMSGSSLFGGVSANNASATANPFGTMPIDNGGFGSGLTSFPPAQPSSLGNSFANSSFPSFNGDNTSASFNPPSSNAFNFSSTASGSNPFAQLNSTSASSASGQNGFSGSIFNAAPSQPVQSSNPFGGFSQSVTTTAAPSGLFNTSVAPSNSLFGSINSNTIPVTTSTTAASNSFGGLAATSTSSAPSSLFSFTKPSSSQPQAGAPTLFGTSAVTPASTFSNSTTSSLFGNKFGAGQQAEGTTAKADQTPSESNGPNVGGAKDSAAPAPGLFNTFGANKGASAFDPFKSSPGSFGGSKTPTQQSANTPAISSSMFKFGAGTENKENVPSTSSSLFANPENRSTPFGSFKSTPPASPVDTATTQQPPVFNFGTPSTSAATVKPGDTTVSSSEGSNLAVNFGASASSKTLQTPSSSSIFAPKANALNASPIVEGSKVSSLFTAPTETGKSWFQSETQSPFTSGSPKGTPQTRSTSLFSTTPQNPLSADTGDTTAKSLFSELEAPSIGFQASNNTQQNSSPNFFDKSTFLTGQTTVFPPASVMPTLTGAAAPPTEPPKPGSVPSIPKAHVPKSWFTPTAASDSVYDLAVQLAYLNTSYRVKLSELPCTADWTSLSQWHYKESSQVLQKIKVGKKQLANAKGVSGDGSSLSVKRNSNADAISDTDNPSPSKKSRPNEVSGTTAPTNPTPFSNAPKLPPPASQTANLFGNILNKSTSSASGSLFALKEAAQNPNPAKINNAATGSLFQMSKPVVTGAVSNKVGTSSFGTTGSLFGNSFASQAQSYEELRAKRKQKDMDDDYDSDEETKEQWSARWEKNEAERIAGEKSKASTNNHDSSSTSVEVEKPPAADKVQPPVTSAPSIFSGFGKPLNGSSSSGLFGSRLGSPASTTAGVKSVFDTPESSQSPANNIFGHLSPVPSANDQDGDDEDEQDQDVQSHGEQNTNPFGSVKRKTLQSESESDDLSEGSRNKKSLLDRMTTSPGRKPPSKPAENGFGSGFSIFNTTNGVKTPTEPLGFNLPGTVSQTAPAKQDGFAGDQTFKAGTPIKFGSSTQENPSVQLIPPSPSATNSSSTPSKPPPANPFAFLSTGSQSAAGSALSSRAGTPLSDAEASGKESVVEDEEADEQLDLSALTEEELAQYDILFHTDQATAKTQAEKASGEKAWEVYARGLIWILKDKATGKALLRMRLKTGKTRLNYNLLPKLRVSISGNGKRMVTAVGYKLDGKIGNIVYILKSPDVAQEFTKAYNANVPF